MGCVCCSISSLISIVIDSLERATLCTVCAMLTCCLTFTIITVLVLGIGIGFHYCYVQNSVEAMGRAAKAAGAVMRSGPQTGPVMRSVDRAAKRGAYPGHAESRNRRAVNVIPPASNKNVTGTNFTISAMNETMSDLMNISNLYSKYTKTHVSYNNVTNLSSL